uniref:Uncharacterized protein n=1 Tax=Steinernema glaseri TaxID=37863 RepID=A0A1I8A538_9BILA
MRPMPAAQQDAWFFGHFGLKIRSLEIQRRRTCLANDTVPTTERFNSYSEFCTNMWWRSSDRGTGALKECITPRDVLNVTFGASSTLLRSLSATSENLMGRLNNRDVPHQTDRLEGESSDELTADLLALA